MVFTSQPGPRNLLAHSAPDQIKKTVILVGDPDASPGALSDAVHGAAGNAAYGNKSVILQITEPATRGDPDSPTTILEERIRGKSEERPVLLRPAGQPLRAEVAENSNSP